MWACSTPMGKGHNQRVLEADKKFQIQNNLAPVLQSFVID